MKNLIICALLCAPVTLFAKEPPVVHSLTDNRFDEDDAPPGYVLVKMKFGTEMLHL